MTEAISTSIAADLGRVQGPSDGEEFFAEGI